MRHVTLEPLVAENEPDEYLADTEDNIMQNGQQLPATSIQNRHYQAAQYSSLISSSAGHHSHNPSSSTALATSSTHQHHQAFGPVQSLREDTVVGRNQMMPSISNLYKGISSTLKSSDSLSINSDENSSPTSWSNESDFDADDDEDSNLFLTGRIVNKNQLGTTRERRHNRRNKKTHLSANQRAPSTSFTQSRQAAQPFGMLFNSNNSRTGEMPETGGPPAICGNVREEGEDDDYNDNEDDNENDAATARASPNRSNVSLRMSRPARICRSDAQNLAETICSRILECANLDEAIKYVEKNRPVINQITRIITHEAPAYRNYDFSRYQIDHSVRESFNPAFWSDREPVITTADGNCQYHAVSISLTGTEEYTPNVRLATAVAVIDNRVWFDQMLRLIDRGTVHGLVKTISRSYAWGDETTLKAIAVAINRSIFLYSCNVGKKDFEIVKKLTLDELLDAFSTKKYCGGTAIHTYADPIGPVQDRNNYIMLFHKSEHFIAVLPTTQCPTTFQPFNPIVPTFV